jgi:hypothetical protein
MDRHEEMKLCLNDWSSDMDLYFAMSSNWEYEGSPATLSRERRLLCESGDIEFRYAVNKNGVKYKQFRLIKGSK